MTQKHTQAELIDWINQQVSPSPYHIVVTNLTTCFHDGVTLCALLHSYYPDPIPFDMLSPNLKKFNIELALTEAENVGIPPSINPTDIWLTRSPDKGKMAELMSLWRRYLEMEDDEVKADLEEKCDVLKAKYNEQDQRNRGYQKEIQQLLDSFKNTSEYAPCKRCGDCIYLDSDKFVRMESVVYHEECHRCYNCSTEAEKFEWYQNEIWCNPCKTLSEEQLGSGAGTAELESRLLEIKQIELVRKEKGSSPFREMERKREEERRRKLEAYKKSQLARAQKETESQSQDPAEKEKTEAAQAERDRALQERKIQEREEERARKQAEEDALRRKIEEQKRVHAEAVRAEEVNFEELKSRRGAELEEIKAKRAGVNPFREMERQAAEERKKKFQRFSGPSSSSGQSNENDKQKEIVQKGGTVRMISKSRPVSTNPFAEMEKKRQLEKLARLRRYAKLSASGNQVKENEAKPKEEEKKEAPPASENVATEEKEETPATEKEDAGETPKVSEDAPVEKAEQSVDELGDLVNAVNDLSEEMIFTEETLEEHIEAYERESAIAGACEELLDVSEEVELLTEAAEIVEAQQRTIQEHAAVIREQEQLLIKQKETIVKLERELAVLKGQSPAPSPCPPPVVS